MPVETIDTIDDNGKIYDKISSLGQDNLLINTKIVHRTFKEQPNLGDGNCLFYSIAHSTFLPNLLDEKNKRLIDKAKQFRKEVCDIYTEIHEKIEATDDKKHNWIKAIRHAFDTLRKIGNQEFRENRILIQGIRDALITFHQTRDEQDKNHDSKICRDKEYAQLSEILILALLHKYKIVLFLFTGKHYLVSVYSHKDPEHTIYLKYNGRDHYESLYPAMEDTIDVRPPSETLPLPSQSLPKSLSRFSRMESAVRASLSKMPQMPQMSKFFTAKRPRGGSRRANKNRKTKRLKNKKRSRRVYFPTKN